MSEEERKFYGSLITECEYWEFDSETNKGKLYDKNGNEIPTYEDLQQENQKLKNRIEEDKEDIRHLLDIINHNCNELKCNSDEWLVLKGWQDRLKEGNNE